jgi:hypothetical protein
VIDNITKSWYSYCSVRIEEYMTKGTKLYADTMSHSERTVAVSSSLAESELMPRAPRREKPAPLKARFFRLSMEKQAAIIGMAEAFSFVQRGEEGVLAPDLPAGD